MTSLRARATKPSYDESQSSYHRAFAAELNQIIDRLPLAKARRVLDSPCGDGFYSRLLARRMDQRAQLDCADLCRIYLSRTRRKLREAACPWQVHEADARQLPFESGTFDVVWCAQSFISLPEPVFAMREMWRVLRNGGSLAILENDLFHHILLPWPADLEVPIQRAIQLASRKRFGSSTKLTPVRQLPHLFAVAGFSTYTKHTFAADRQAPWSESVRRFLKFHIQDLRKLIGRHLSTRIRTGFERYMNAKSKESLFGERPMDLTCLNVLYEARK